MRCPRCGIDNPADHKFCLGCGTVLAEPINLRDRSLDEGRSAIRAAVARREMTDEVLMTLWAILPVLFSLGFAMFGFALFFMGLEYSDTYETGAFSLSSTALLGLTVLVVGGVLAQSLYGILAFKLVKRQNDHYSREKDLRAGVMTLLNAAASTPEKQAGIMPEMSQMAWLHANIEEERNPWFWGLVPALNGVILAVVVAAVLVMAGEEWDMSLFAALLAFIPLEIAIFVLTVYMFYFLGKNIYEHDGHWNTFASNARMAMAKLGFPPATVFALKRLPERSFIVYLIVTIFIGVFVYYWWYTLVKDPNEHFKTQWTFEDSLVASIGPPTR